MVFMDYPAVKGVAVHLTHCVFIDHARSTMVIGIF